MARHSMAPIDECPDLKPALQIPQSHSKIVLLTTMANRDSRRNSAFSGTFSSHCGCFWGQNGQLNYVLTFSAIWWEFFHGNICVKYEKYEKSIPHTSQNTEVDM